MAGEGLFGLVALFDWRYFGFIGTRGGRLLARSSEGRVSELLAGTGEAGLFGSLPRAFPTMASWADAASKKIFNGGGTGGRSTEAWSVDIAIERLGPSLLARDVARGLD